MQQNSQPITQPSPHWPPQQGYGQQPVQGYHFPQPDAAQGYAEHAPAQSLPFPPQGSGQQLPFNRYPPQPVADQDPNYGYAQQGQHGSAGPPWGQQPDPRGYDLGNYMSAPGQGYAQPDSAHFQPQDPAQFGPPQGYGETDAEFDEAMAEDEEEPRRGRRGLMIVAALVGAIGLGGGMAYAYKTFFPSRTGPVAVIKDTQGPVKSKPEFADGKGFPHTDKKLLNRLGDEGAPANAAAAPEDRVIDDPNAPRKVRLIPISPNGAEPPAAAPSAPPGLIVVPGVTLQNTGPPPVRAQYPPQAPPSAARVQLPLPGPPVKAVQQPPVKVASAANMPPPAAAEPAAPVKKAPAKSPVPKTKEASAAPAVTASSGAGFVAVLSSQKSRMDALKIFANMQEKYGGVLSSKTPDVQEANLGDKGVWYRLVVGPPGSRDSAAGLCSQLKTAGYTGCWVTSY